MIINRTFLSLTTLFLFLSNISFAEEEILAETSEIESKNSKKKLINGRFITELYDENGYHSNDDNNKFNSEYTKSYLDLNFNITDNLYVKSLTALEPTNVAIQNIPDRTNRHFKNESLFTRELSLNYQASNFSVGLGKINNLNFGKYWDNQNKIWATNLVKTSYRQIEKIGFKGDYAIGDEKKNGRYIFGFSIFTNDSKYTDNSLINDRSSTLKSNATPGDTRNLNSYIASLDINYDFDNEEKLSYHFAYMNLAVNGRQSSVTPAKISDQKAIALNMNYQYPISENILINPIIEYVTMSNVGGNIDHKTNMLTTNIDVFLYKNWNVGISHVIRADLIQAENGLDTSITEFSFGYRFPKSSILSGLQLLAGYKKDIIDNKSNPIKTDSVGAMARYVKDF